MLGGQRDLGAWESAQESAKNPRFCRDQSRQVDPTSSLPIFGGRYMKFGSVLYSLNLGITSTESREESQPPQYRRSPRPPTPIHPSVLVLPLRSGDRMCVLWRSERTRAPTWAGPAHVGASYGKHASNLGYMIGRGPDHVQSWLVAWGRGAVHQSTSCKSEWGHAQQ